MEQNIVLYNSCDVFPINYSVNQWPKLHREHAVDVEVCLCLGLSQWTQTVSCYVAQIPFVCYHFSGFVELFLIEKLTLIYECHQGLIVFLDLSKLFLLQLSDPVDEFVDIRLVLLDIGNFLHWLLVEFKRLLLDFFNFLDENFLQLWILTLEVALSFLENLERRVSLLLVFQTSENITLETIHLLVASVQF